MRYYCPVCDYECPYCEPLEDGDCGCSLYNPLIDCDAFYGLDAEDYEIPEEVF